MVRDPNIKHVTLPSLDLTGVLSADCVVAGGWIPGGDSRDDLGLFAPLLTARPRNDESIDYRPSIDRHNERMNEPAMDGSITLQVFNDDGCASPAIFSLSATAAAAARNNY